MSLDLQIKQCCESDPVWIFIYSDGSIFAICKDDYEKPEFRSGVKEVINVETQDSYLPDKLFGENNVK